MKMVLIVALWGLMAVMGGCGGSDGSSSPALSGYVADGYLRNATVFLDVNNNFQLDAGEPSTTSGPGGYYRLTGLDPALLQYQVVVLAQAGVTFDEDNPGQPIAGSYLLCAPAGATAFISPISALVRERMLADPNLTLVQAVEQVRTELQLAAGTDPLGNYIAGNNLQLHTMAQEMVALMIEQRAQIMNQDGTAVDPLRYRLMLQTMNQELAQMMMNARNEDGMESGFMETMRTRIRTALEG